MAKLKKWSNVTMVKQYGAGGTASTFGNSKGARGSGRTPKRIIRGGAGSFGGGFGTDKGGSQKRVSSAPARPPRRRP